MAIVRLPLIVIAIGIVWFRRCSNLELRASSVLLDADAAPNRNLTPGRNPSGHNQRAIS